MTAATAETTEQNTAQRQQSQRLPEPELPQPEDIRASSVIDGWTTQMLQRTLGAVSETLNRRNLLPTLFDRNGYMDARQADAV